MTKRARKIESATLKHAHTFIIRRWDNVKSVRRFALGWLVLVALLIGASALQMLQYRESFSRVAAADGGTYAEGVVGPLETINPIFSTTSAERSASELIFAGLVGYDRNNSLRGELADTWRIENNGTRYIFDLKQNVMWHDGTPVTADDVVFTIDRIKNPLTRSPLLGSWRGIAVKKTAPYQVTFDLPSAYSPFPHALTLGILPKHLLNDVPAESLRENEFNREPVGSGAFVFNRLQLIDPDNDRVVLYLTANGEYVRGTPKLERFQLHVYGNHEQVKQAFLTSEVNAAADLTTDDMRQIYEQRPQARDLEATIYDGTYAMFRMDSPKLSDVKVREALRLSVDRSALIDQLHGFGRTLNGPLLGAHYASLSTKMQPRFDVAEAGKKLDEAGWTLQNNIRTKDGVPLELTVVAPQIGDYPTILEATVENWRKLGIKVETQLASTDTIQQNVLLPRAYDVLIYELALGVDPDVYAYWHSSQADPRGLNLANYKSEVSDEALASARSRAESGLRQPKYEAFVDRWIADVPAVALYQPVLNYVTTESSRGLSQNAIVNDTIARYRSVELWTVQTAVYERTP